MNHLIIKPESDGTMINQGLVVVAPVGDFELLLCHGTASIVRMMRDLILQLTKSSIYSTKSLNRRIREAFTLCGSDIYLHV